MDMAAMIRSVQMVYDAARFEPGVSHLCILCGLFSAYAEAGRQEVIRRQALLAVTEDVSDTGQRRLLSVKEVSQRLGCSTWVAHERIRTGKLPAVRDGDYRVEEAELEKYVARHRK